ncbi:hypothetical protein AgCh_036976 [Apium graveolens]
MTIDYRSCAPPPSNSQRVHNVTCVLKERQALLKFQQGLVDDNGQLISWGTKDCCTWRGVHCDKLTGYVVALDLHRQDFSFDLPLTGNISASLLELQHLNYLDLGGNNFGDSQMIIPEFLGSLGNLQYLNLADNSFVGEIPHGFANLTSLHFLDLGYNVLEVVNLDWLTNLGKLRYLDLSGISLATVDWLQAVSSLSFLTELHLPTCGLPGVSSTTNYSSMALSIVDLSNNAYVSFSELEWLFNSSSSLVDVDISSNTLQGPIPDDFGNMVKLRNLSLASNALEGKIPESFGKMVLLTNLFLSNNLLQGNIPESFGRNLSQLQWLDLFGNNFDGELQEFLKGLFDGEGATGSLETLRLGNNKLTGSLPDITRFSSLKTFGLRGNQLNGSFPESFSQVSNLVFLDLAKNRITGTLPDLTYFKSLKKLDLGNNQLHGKLPKSIAQLIDLELLDLSSNLFKDTVSEAHFSNLSSLKVLHLAYNSFSLEFSTNWLPPFQLDVIRLAYCRLGNHFPKWIRTQNNYSELDMSYAAISDKVPKWFWDLSPRLTYLNLSYNHLSGSVPDLSSKLVSYSSLDFNSNQFVGSVPSLPPDLTSLHLSKNMFTGPVSFLCSIANGYFTSLDLSDNKLSGELPDCWKDMPELVIFNLGNNNFSGKVPSSLGSLYQLQTLNLRHNSLGGELPLSMKNCSKLNILDVGNNKFSGTIPAWVGTHLTSLIVLSLRSNKFHGSIPPEVCHLNSIQILDLSQNNISGKIPACISNFTALVQSRSSSGALVFNISAYEGYYYQGGDYVGNALVQWKRHESEYRNTLGYLKSIDLSSNKLVGSIPGEFASLKELISLNLSRNSLTGSIMQKIGQLNMLESLDLSQNQLSGLIPKGFVGLNYLSVLDLSYNNLSGKIPSSTQLQSFDASNYAGNVELCGLPLPKKCPGDETDHQQNEDDNLKDDDEDDDNEKVVTTGFYVSSVLGFAVGFWLVFGTLQMKPVWEHAYFKFLKNTKEGIYKTISANAARIGRICRC